jgi:hypothetical protein
MPNDIQATPKNLSIEQLEYAVQNTSLKQGSFLGRTVVQISSKEREVNQANSKLELGESLSILANVHVCNLVLRFEKDFNAVESLSNRKVQVLSQS